MSSRLPRRVPLRLLAPLLALVVSVGLTGCGSKSATDLGDPATVLKTAQQKLTDTSGVDLTLSTDNLPSGVQGIRSAKGTVTSAPGFVGSLTVVISAGAFPVPVIAVGGKVYAQIPLTPGYSEINPGEYGAPDPAQLTSADNGLPAILGATTDPQAGDQVRGGPDNNEVLTTYTGKVPDTAAAHIVPGASGDFAVTYEIDAQGQLRQAALTGVFYKGSPSMTYTLTLDNYGTTKSITAPQ